MNELNLNCQDGSTLKVDEEGNITFNTMNEVHTLGKIHPQGVIREGLYGKVINI